MVPADLPRRARPGRGASPSSRATCSSETPSAPGPPSRPTARRSRGWRPTRRTCCRSGCAPTARRTRVAVTADKKRGIRSYPWTEDSRSILFEQDADGDENFHLFQVELASKNVRDLTPWQGVRASAARDLVEAAQRGARHRQRARSQVDGRVAPLPRHRRDGARHREPRRRERVGRRRAAAGARRRWPPPRKAAPSCACATTVKAPWKAVHHRGPRGEPRLRRLHRGRPLDRHPELASTPTPPGCSRRASSRAPSGCSASATRATSPTCWGTPPATACARRPSTSTDASSWTPRRAVDEGRSRGAQDRPGGRLLVEQHGRRRHEVDRRRDARSRAACASGRTSARRRSSSCSSPRSRSSRGCRWR